jgi:predicted nuclease of predicted toxin-antitoxin system
MRFLIDRCAGSLVARWLRSKGHDVVESRERGPDPGDQTLLEWAASESRILITIDTDFGQLIFHEGISHSGLIRLPDVRANERLRILEDVLDRFSNELQKAYIITVKGGRVRLSRSPQ